MRNFQPITLISRGGKRVLFRSSLEGRWSVYFDLMNLKWEYEPTRFDIGGGITYTPDFFVDEIGWIEIKPNRKTLDESLPRIEKFIQKSGERVYAFCAPEVAPSVYILAEIPMRIIELDRLASKIVLAGISRRNDFKTEPELSSIAIESMIKATNRSKLQRGEFKTQQERQLVAKWKREPLTAMP